MLKFLLITSVLIILVFTSSETEAGKRDNTTCGIVSGQPLKNAYGPFDYTNQAHQEKLPIVIGAHFTREVATLKRGTTQTTPHGDIDYTLRAIPNYHPALFAASQLEKNERNTLSAGKIFQPKYFTAECYLKRALYFQPKDHVSRMLYAMYLQQNKNYKKAEKEYLFALSFKPKDPELNYNLGLLYVYMGLIKKAEKHAELAYSAGHPLPGLKNKIDTLQQAVDEN